MAIDMLQAKIRKLKNPSMIRMDVLPEQVPPHLVEEYGSISKAAFYYERELMQQLKDLVPALYFSIGSSALQGAEALEDLRKNLEFAHELGYYVLLEYSGIVSVRDAEQAAQILLDEKSPYQCDGVLITGTLGVDGIQPFVQYLENTNKDLFVTVRTGNKSAASVQDLMTGGRVSHMSVADIVSRLGKPFTGKYGYSRVCGVGPATSAHVLKNLRTKYKDMFLLVHGYDSPSANAKLCFEGFDRLGYGAIVLNDQEICGAWKDDEAADGKDFAQQARSAAERMKKNLLRYIDIL